MILNIGLSNVNSLIRKLPLVMEFLNENNLHILCITETHLLQSVQSSFVDIPSYSIVRNDVLSTHAKHGVCLYIHQSIKFEKIDISCPNVISISLPELNVHIVGAYRPPSQSATENQVMLDYLSRYCIGKEVIILGDFNLPSLSWDQIAPLGHASATDRLFLETFLVLGLTQWVRETTFPRSANILDLVLTSETDRVGTIKVHAPLPGCDHCAITCQYIFDFDRPEDPLLPLKRQWHRGNYKRIANCLEDVDWDTELSYLICQEAYTHFLKVLTPIIEAHVPVSRETKVPSPPFKTRPPTSLINRRKTAWHNFKRCRLRLGRSSPVTKQAMQDFFTLNRETRDFVKDQQVSYEKGLAEKLINNPKFFHGYLRRKKVGCPSVGPLRLDDGNLSDDPSVMADVFAQAFVSVYGNSVPIPTLASHQTFPGQMCPTNLELQDVLSVLKSLDSNSAAGLDGVHPCLLKSCAAQLAYPLYQIFILSLRECSLPLEWTHSCVAPIFKKGSRLCPLNYRPVSITSVPCKVLERHIVKHLTSFLESNEILSEHQFGFRAGRSTMDQLILVYDEVSLWVDEGNIVDLILFDFSKAFDLVSHPILLDKLNCLGVDRSQILWIEAFLTRRTMSVSIKGKVSSSHRVTSGVPQGSVLGPILFLIYINHIAVNLSRKYKIFADDLKIYMKVSHDSTASYESDISASQKDIDILIATSRSWGLTINKEKCAVMRFQRKFHHSPAPQYLIDSSPIPFVTSHMNLGVLVDSALKFHEHISKTANKSAALAHNVLKSTACRSPEFMMPIYSSHIRPIMEYCSCLWHTGYVGDTRILESVQRLWTKQVIGLKDMDYGARLRALKQYSVRGRLLRADMIYYWKVFHGKCALAPGDLFKQAEYQGTRGHRFKIELPRTRTDVRKRSFAVRGIATWNQLPDNVVATRDLSSFKKRLAECLGDALYRFHQ